MVMKGFSNSYKKNYIQSVINVCGSQIQVSDFDLAVSVSSQLTAVTLLYITSMSEGFVDNE